MTPEHHSPLNRYRELIDLLQQYNYQYHVLNEPTVSDALYDSLMRELKAIEQSHPDLISPDSPTQRVGGSALDGFQKLHHSRPMISLNDVFTRNEVEAWVKRMDKALPGKTHEYFCDIKMDGLSCALVYKDGVLQKAITRGDGLVGEDVTQNVRTIQNVPLRLNPHPHAKHMLTGITEIRGEIVLHKDDFLKLNQARVSGGSEPFKNPRNLAAGTIRQLDPTIVASRPLRFYGYDLLRENPSEVATNAEAYTMLTQLGIMRNPKSEVFSSLDGVMKYVDYWQSARDSLAYNTDGLVIKVNDRSLYDSLGSVGKYPRGAVAYKYPAEETTTVVRDIVISIGRTGAATPVAVFNSVEIAGTTVQHASLHNADEIARKDIRVGDTVVIYKAGDIIPQVQRIIPELRPTDSKPFDFENELSRQYPELEFTRESGEVVFRVKGLTGPVILKRNLQHFASKSALDIHTLGEKNVNALVDAGLVADLADIYTLTQEKLLLLDRFAELSAKKLVDAIQAKKEPTLERFVYGLGIRHVGVQTAIDLVAYFGSLKKIKSATIDELLAVNGIGIVVAESIAAWFADEDNVALLDKFVSLGIKPQYVQKSAGTLANIRIAITGSLLSMSRDDAAEKIRSKGGIFQSSVGKDTTYLVSGGKIGASKLKKAMSFGTTIINEEELLRLIQS